MNVHAPDHPMRVFRTKPVKEAVADHSCWNCRRSQPTDDINQINCPRHQLKGVSEQAQTCDDFFDSRKMPAWPPGQEAPR